MAQRWSEWLHQGSKELGFLDMHVKLLWWSYLPSSVVQSLTFIVKLLPLEYSLPDPNMSVIYGIIVDPPKLVTLTTHPSIESGQSDYPRRVSNC